MGEPRQASPGLESGPGRRPAWIEDLSLTMHLVAYEVRKSNAGTALGLAWSAVEPVLLLGTYFFLFVVILQVEYNGPGGVMGHLLSMFAGLVPWLYLNGSIGIGLGSLNTHAALVKQINFPIHLLPLITVAQGTVEFLSSLVLLLVLGLIVGSLGTHTLILLPAAISLAVLLVGATSILSCYAVMFPDLQKLLPTFLRVVFFVTPVLYEPTMIPAHVRFVAIANPLAYVITPFRYAMFGNPDSAILTPMVDLFISFLVSGAVLALALGHRGYVRKTVVDYL